MDVNVSTYQFSWNDKTKYVTASTFSEARRKFQERYGFWPTDTLVDIAII